MPSSTNDSTGTLVPTLSEQIPFDGDIEKNIMKLDDEQVNPLANYVVPVLPKGIKTVLSVLPSKWTRFWIWYNLYRQVRRFQSCLNHSLNRTRSLPQFFTLSLTLNTVGILLAALGRFPYAQDCAAAISLGNVLAAVAFRNELLLRGLFWVLVTLFQKVWSPSTSPIREIDISISGPPSRFVSSSQPLFNTLVAFTLGVQFQAFVGSPTPSTTFSSIILSTTLSFLLLE